LSTHVQGGGVVHAPILRRVLQQFDDSALMSSKLVIDTVMQASPSSRQHRHIRKIRIRDVRPIRQEVLNLNAFAQTLKTQRWDDHRYYHHSRINQSLHLVSALSFLCAYVAAVLRPRHWRR
jgi:hypothetical protein